MLGTEGEIAWQGRTRAFSPIITISAHGASLFRTVWMTLLGVLVIAGWWWLTGLQTDLILFIAVFTVVDIWQLATTYAAWKAEEKHGPEV